MIITFPVEVKIPECVFSSVPTTAGLSMSPGWFCGPEPQWRGITCPQCDPQEAKEEDRVGFGKWSRHIWVVHLDTRFGNPGLWSSMYVTWDVVRFEGLNSYSYKHNCSYVFFMFHLTLFSDIKNVVKQ